MISCIFSPLIHIHLPDTNGVERRAIVSRNKDTKLNSSSLHRRDIQCSQPHCWKVEAHRYISEVEDPFLLISLARYMI